MKPNLVFYVDHRFRDLLVLSKIAYNLKSKNNIFYQTYILILLVISIMPFVETTIIR